MEPDTLERVGEACIAESDAYWDKNLYKKLSEERQVHKDECWVVMAIPNNRGAKTKKVKSDRINVESQNNKTFS